MQAFVRPMEYSAAADRAAAEAAGPSTLATPPTGALTKALTKGDLGLAAVSLVNGTGERCGVPCPPAAVEDASREGDWCLLELADPMPEYAIAPAAAAKAMDGVDSRVLELPLRGKEYSLCMPCCCCSYS